MIISDSDKIQCDNEGTGPCYKCWKGTGENVGYVEHFCLGGGCEWNKRTQKCTSADTEDEKATTKYDPLVTANYNLHFPLKGKGMYIRIYAIFCYSSFVNNNISSIFQKRQK